MLDQYITQAITLSTVLLRSAVTAQSAIYTSLVAGIVLERHGVPLYRVAEISMIRCANDGPLRLAWLLVSSARKSILQAALVIVLLLTTLAVQFSSTLLVSDLGLASLVGDARDGSLRLHMSQEVISLNRQTNDWILRPRAYVPFAWSEAFLFFRTNGTHELWRSSDGRFLSVNLALPNVSYTDGEWITYERPIAELTPEGRRINKGVLRLDMTICFQQVAINFADIKVSSEKDLTEPKVTWDAERKVWDTRKVQRQLGIGPQPNTTTRRGIYSVDFIQNRQHLNATQYLTNKLINDLYNSPRDNISIFMDPLGSGISHVKPNVEYQAIFSDILNATNRPGVAMQSTLTALSGSIIDDALPQAFEV
ncbi:hypothetical protein K4K60_011049 [Colletotrichum sp. SAR11_57]|nr:hypothetical protein K4K60_011049 [Colletotrichum sp. SAR11_57]